MPRRDMSRYLCVTAFLSASVQLGCSPPPARVQPSIYAGKPIRDSGDTDIKEGGGPAGDTDQEGPEEKPASDSGSDSPQAAPEPGSSVPSTNPQAPQPGLPQPVPVPVPVPGGSSPKPTQPSPGPVPQPLPPVPAPLPSPTIPAMEAGDCPSGPAVNQITKWWATMEGTMVPNSGTLVRKENGKSVAKVTWKFEDWHVVPVWIGNASDANVDLTKSKTMILGYQAPADFYIQMRPGGAGWSGGAQWGVKIPKSPDKFTMFSVPLEEASWGVIPGLEKSSHPFREVLGMVHGMVIVGKAPGDYAFNAMIFDNFTPPCR